MAKRTVISVSVSPRNEHAVIVAEALAARGISLTCGGGQILAWAAAYLTEPPPTPKPQEKETQELFGMSVDELDARLDDF